LERFYDSSVSFHVTGVKTTKTATATALKVRVGNFYTFLFDMGLVWTFSLTIEGNIESNVR